MVKKYLNDNLTVETVADINYDLYVTDYGNHRIQFFKFWQLNRSTLSTSKSKTSTISLNMIQLE